LGAGAGAIARLGGQLNATRRRLLIGLGAFAALAGGTATWYSHDRFHYLDGDTAAFRAAFPPPPAQDSPQTREELAQLLAMQQARTPADVRQAQEDRKTDVARFYVALGLTATPAPPLPVLRRLAENVEDDIRPYIRAAKDRFRRPRPYVAEPRLHPCIGDVRDDLSFPSGHAAWGYAMAYLLADLVPERRDALLQRARQFAGQRMVCGVHFLSDIQAGGAAAEPLMKLMRASPGFQRDAAAARSELRAALELR
jgi:acid phosphatase (class A)